MKKILVLHTGGTISMEADGQGHVSSRQVNPMTQVSSPLEDIQVTSLDMFNIPSPHVTFQHMIKTLSNHPS